LLDEDYLILSTIHSAKGQEWKAVFVLNCVDGCIPSDLAVGSTAEIEEERRLLYVAMTRAKDHLHIIVPQRFFYAHQQRSNGTGTCMRSGPDSFPTRLPSTLNNARGPRLHAKMVRLLVQQQF
jgi:superfamily I DNA/RNA helicase